MKHLLKLLALSTVLVLSSNTFGQETTTSCISDSDLNTIAQSFPQYKKHLTGKSEYCLGDIKEKELVVLNSLVVLKNTRPLEPSVIEDDALTFRAVNEKNWWTYFTNRADTIAILPNCQPNVVAYVQPYWSPKKIHICETFFRLSQSSQASTMMHEVRHFDGHRHVTCSQGNEINNSGACDGKITAKGSYAISVQTLVGLGRSPQTSTAEKASLESEAIYMAFNKFNEVPRVKLLNLVYLTNTVGEVYEWVVGKGLSLFRTLQEPSVLTSNGANMTIYPVDSASDAYRVTRSDGASVDAIGMYANHYNAESVTDREQYKSISYLGAGGLLKENTLYTLCSNSATGLTPKQLDPAKNYKRIINIAKEGSMIDHESYLLAEDGSLTKYKCLSPTTTALDMEETQLKIAPGSENIVQSFSLGNTQYAVTEDGEFVRLNKSNNTYTAELVILPTINNADFTSATHFNKSELF